jgi:cyclophilin family peptidyl-prolyl cis-trans isomerase
MTKNTDGGATITTNFGDVEIEFYPKDAPKNSWEF